MARCLSKQDIVSAYLGDGTPGGWATIEDAAKSLELDPEILRDLLRFHGVELWEGSKAAHKHVWEVLTEEWDFAEGDDFGYQVEFNGRRVDFALYVSSLAICCGEVARNEIRTDHFGDFSVVTIAYDGSKEETQDMVRRILKDNSVRRRDRRYAKEAQTVW